MAKAVWFQNPLAQRGKSMIAEIHGVEEKTKVAVTDTEEGKYIALSVVHGKRVSTVRLDQIGWEKLRRVKVTFK